MSTLRLAIPYLSDAQANKAVTINAAFDSFDASVALGGSGSPEGVTNGSVGDLYRDTGNGFLYVKGGGGANTGWQLLGLGPSPFWQKITVPYTLFNGAAALNFAATLLTLPAKGVIHAVNIRPTASFTGGAIATFTLSVGIVGNLTKYAGAFNCFQAPGNTVFQLSSVVGAENMAIGTVIQVNAVATGANLTALTAGSAEIEVLSSLLI